MKAGKNEYPVKFGIVGLDEPPLAIDISICLPEKKPVEETKRPKKQDSVRLF